MKMNISTESAFDLMEEILPDVVALIGDEAIINVRKEFREKKELKTGKAMSDMLPAILKNKVSVFHLVACMTGKSVDEVAAQPFAETIENMRNGFTDEMLSFFGCCLRMALLS